MDVLRRAVGEAGADHLHALAWGRDSRPVQDRDPEKSISADHTTSVDLTHEADVLRELLRLAGEVSERVRRRDLVARTVGIKIRFADFRTITRVRTLSSWTDSTAVVYDAAADLYRGLRLDQPRIRLVGVKCENLRSAAEAPEQLMLDTSAVQPPVDAARPWRGSGRGYGEDPVRQRRREAGHTAHPGPAHTPGFVNVRSQFGVIRTGNFRH